MKKNKKASHPLDIFAAGVCYPGNNDINSLGMKSPDPKISGNMRWKHVDNENPVTKELPFGGKMIYNVHSRKPGHMNYEDEA